MARFYLSEVGGRTGESALDTVQRNALPWVGGREKSAPVRGRDQVDPMGGERAQRSHAVECCAADRSSVDMRAEWW